MRSLFVRTSDGQVVGVYDTSPENLVAPEGIKIMETSDDKIGPHHVLIDGVFVNTFTVTLTADDFANAVQAHVDNAAKSRGYGDGFALSTYINSTLPQWAQEAEVFIAWRDAVWIYAYTELYKVQQGQRPIPTINELIAELPTINWPE